MGGALLLTLLLGELLTSLWAVESQMFIDEGSYSNYSHSVRETELAVMRKGELQDYARGIGLKKIDDLKKPELLAQVKDKVYADAHGGKHRPR